LNEFISWELLSTYTGAILMTGILTQFTKNWGFVERIPTQLWAFVLAFFVILCANVFSASVITIGLIFESLFNSVIVAIAAIGGYDVLSKKKDE
jgi:hypothetical protein